MAASVITGDAALEVDGPSSFIRHRRHNKHNTASIKTDDLQGAGQTALIVNTPAFDKAPLSTAASSGRTLASATRFGLEPT